jgi:hypothetical protein
MPSFRGRLGLCLIPVSIEQEYSTVLAVWGKTEDTGRSGLPQAVCRALSVRLVLESVFQRIGGLAALEKSPCPEEREEQSKGFSCSAHHAHYVTSYRGKPLLAFL